MANKNSILTSTIYTISEEEVADAQLEWGAGIVHIGKVYTAGGDYKRAASDHINTLYGYDISKVLFKPTLASIHQFRNTFDAALSYFIGGNPTYAEDKGFALTPWTAVRWENVGIINSQTNMAVAMGNYYFTPKPSKEGEPVEEVKVEYTFGYVKDTSGKLRIVVHKSSLPFDPEETE